MDQAAIRTHLPIPKKGRFAALAWLLLFAQLFSQLHALEHLDSDEHDEHAQEVCHICIQSTGLDLVCVDTTIASAIRFKTPRPTDIGYWGVAPEFAAAYLGRAPPLPTAIT